jgi:TPR repeat protein
MAVQNPQLTPYDPSKKPTGSMEIPGAAAYFGRDPMTPDSSCRGSVRHIYNCVCHQVASQPDGGTFEECVNKINDIHAGIRATTRDVRAHLGWVERQIGRSQLDWDQASQRLWRVSKRPAQNGEAALPQKAVPQPIFSQNTSSKLGARYFTHYWTNETWKISEEGNGQLLGELYSTQFVNRGVAAGDFIYPVTVIKGELYLLAKMEAEAVCDGKTGAKRLGEDPDDFYDDLYIAFPRQSTLMNFQARVPAEITRKLTFVSGNRPSSLVFLASGGLDQQTLRGVRELTPQAAEMLDQLLPPLEEYHPGSQSEAEEPDASPSENDQPVETDDQQEEIKSVSPWHEAAERGNARAQYRLGLRYHEGHGIGQNDVLAARWFRKAAIQGYAEAQYNLGCCYDAGLGVNKDQTKAAEWYRKAAEQGYAKAQYNLGVCYFHGTGVDNDKIEAEQWLRKAAEQGHPKAQCQLGDFCYDGGGSKKDYTMAARWYRKAAKQGDARAQCCLGICYTKGQGVIRNKTEAVKWFLRAADRENAEAQFRLGLCYAKGAGVFKDVGEAAMRYRQAADQGHAAAQYQLGRCYDEGLGVDENKTLAARWYRKAAEQGLADAQYNLAVCYDEGSGLRKDLTKAVKWYRKAAEQGNAAAQCNLGVCYMRGNGVDRNKTEAVKWLFRAADQGDATAQSNLRHYQVRGHGITPDKVEAAKWYRKIAYRGDPEAQFKLGFCYARGIGVGKDVVEAARWYLAAADQGFELAMVELRKLGR